MIKETLLDRVGGLETFRRNWSWRSHSPEARAISAIDGGAESIEAGAQLLADAGASSEQVADWTERAIKLWLAYQAAGARTANPMVTGPANFPVARNQKACEVERKRGDEYFEFVKDAKGWLSRQARREERAALSVEAAAVDHRTVEFDGVKLVQNTTLDRIQLVFDGKPDPVTIGLLKKSAFRWSPREGAWQRQNTNNGIRAAYAVLHALGHEKGQLISEGKANA